MQYDYFQANAGHYRGPVTGVQIACLKRSTGMVPPVGARRF